MISIVIITKNEEKYLPKLLNSIKKQNFKDYEIIVSDASSTDNTREIARFYGCKVIDGGLPSVGRNSGARVASGDVLMFLDADGIIPKDFLKKSFEEFKRRRLSCASCFYIPIENRVVDRMLYLIYSILTLVLQYISPHAGGYCIIVRKNVFERVKGFDENLPISEDHHFAKKCSKVGKFRVLLSSYVMGDMRKFKTEGRLSIFVKYLYYGIYRIYFGDSKKPVISYNLHGGVKIKRGNSSYLYEKTEYTSRL
ncbi:MAG TPA: glycosyltransferase [Candidatus Paceibacterota bacterium]|nr:glycosyltransferase [Candidatus Paceibacterota bacterium]